MTNTGEKYFQKNCLCLSYGINNFGCVAVDIVTYNARQDLY